MQNSPARSVVEVGTIIDETYIIEALIGRGGMGAVYLASHKRLQGKKVAIKTLHADLGGEEILARFKREADIASQLDHPNIVKVENYNVLPDGTPYIVYEYLQGESLAQRITDGGAMSIESVFSILRQLGSALGAAHRLGVVHRDLKPQNIFLQPSESDGRAVEIAKVLDFGISKILGGTQSVKTQEATLLGTPQYMAPEQATGQHSAVDERTDIFALGAILYEMVSGKPAFSGASIPEVVFKVVYEEPKPLSEVAPNVADVIVTVIKKAMAKVPADRYAHVSDLVEAMTGSPLSMVRKPKVSGGLAANTPSQNLEHSANRSTEDAFAQTMGSGDHGESPVAPPVITNAPTLPSQPGVPKRVDDVASASTVMQSPAVAPPPVEPRRSNGGLAIALVAVAAIGGGVAWFALRGGGEKPAKHEEHAPHPRLAETGEPVERPAVKPAVIAAVAADAAVPVAPVVKADKPVVVKADATAKKPPVVDDDSGDETIRNRLKEAEAAYHSGDFTKAEHLANFIITHTEEGVGEGQMAHAFAIHGLVACSSLHNNQSDANGDLRHLAKFPRFRARLIKGCKDANIELSAN
ncbi:MAG: serine/threonine-protein kinase [Kofleriaceae bacterium]